MKETVSSKQNPFIIVLGGTSSAGKSTTANSLMTMLGKIYSKDQISIFSFDSELTDATRQEFRRQANINLLKNGFTDGYHIQEKIHTLNSTERAKVDHIFKDIIFSIIHKNIAEKTVSAIQCGKIVIIDILDVANMVKHLKYQQLENIAVFSILLYVPIKAYVNRVNERNKRAIAKNSDGDVLAIMEDIRYSSEAISQFGDLFFPCTFKLSPNIGHVSSNELSTLICQSAEYDQQIIETLIASLNKTKSKMNSKQSELLQSLSTQLQNHENKTTSNYQYLEGKILSDFKETIYLVPRIPTNLVINTEEFGADSIANNILSILPAILDVAKKFSYELHKTLIDVLPHTNVEQLKEKQARHSLFLHKRERELLYSWRTKHSTITFDNECDETHHAATNNEPSNNDLGTINAKLLL